MDKRYEPLIIEEKWSELWAKNNLGKKDKVNIAVKALKYLPETFL